jgi:hypothetical protein
MTLRRAFPLRTVCFLPSRFADAVRGGMLGSMETMSPPPPRTIDVTGLPEEAVRAVESIVSMLRPRPPAPSSGSESAEEWSRRLRAWAASHARRDALADDTRDGIYEGRGE